MVAKHILLSFVSPGPLITLTLVLGSSDVPRWWLQKSGVCFIPLQPFSHGRRSFKIHGQNKGSTMENLLEKFPLISSNVQAVPTGLRQLPARMGDRSSLGGGVSPVTFSLLDITKDGTSWCVVESKVLRKLSLLVYYVILRKEAQARSIHPLCRRQTACDVGSSGLFLVRIFQSYEFDRTLAWCPDRTQCRHNSIFL